VETSNIDGETNLKIKPAAKTAVHGSVRISQTFICIHQYLTGME
jgi:hypothetical protein